MSPVAPLVRRFVALLLCAAPLLGATVPVAPSIATARLPAAPVGGRDWHVAPEGRPDGDGSPGRPWDIATALAHPAGVQPGDTLWLHGGNYGQGGGTRYTSRLQGVEGRPIVVRQQTGQRATIDGGILGLGAWTWFWDFEITNRSENRTANAKERPPGLYLHGRGNSAINLIIHNTGHPAVGTWDGVGDGAFVYGCIIWGTGTYDTDRAERRRGSAIYAQNRDGTRVIMDLISFRNFSTGMKAYTEKGYANGFHFEGNITFDNGDRLLFVSGRDHPAERVRLINNYTYRTPTENDPPARLGYPDVDQIDAVVTGNVFVNGTHADGAFWAKRFKSLQVTGNRFVSPNVLVTWIPPQERRDYRWDENTYFGGTKSAFRIDQALYPWEEWRTRTHFDARSTRVSARPGGVDTFLRPNRYDPRRAHLAVYNWDSRDRVAVDLASFLKPGERYRIVDAQHYWGEPVARGTYAGQPVSIPMNTTRVSEIRGRSLVPNVHTSAEFGAFVVMKEP